MKHKFKVGDVVTCKKRKEAYYSNYGGRPPCWFEPGDVGIVGAVDVPCVQEIKGKDTFVCVDFVKPGVPQRADYPEADYPWQAALFNDNITRLSAQ